MPPPPPTTIRNPEATDRCAGRDRAAIAARRLRPVIGTLLAALAVFALVPAAAGASEQTSTSPSSTGTTTPAETASPNEPTATVAPGAPATTPATNPATTTTETSPAPAPTSPSGPGSSSETAAPQVRTQHAQGSTAGGSSSTHTHAKSQGASGGASANKQSEKSGASSSAEAPGRHRAPAPSTLTPPLPLTLGSPISGVSSFFIESFQIPPFLLPIYQAAGTAYGVPWQVLAAINQVETDYGRDLSVSSAGAEGWMQFLPAEWSQYGVDANGDGFKDPYNPADAIFTAARYLKAAGGDADIRGAVFSYNHSQAYVESVMLRAQLLGGTPAQLLGAVTGLTEARFPVHAPSHYSDGFATVPESGGAAVGTPKTLVGTTIYSAQGAPAIAVQDGEITGLGETPSLGRYVTLRDAHGNTYTYAELGSVATLYPVLEPHEHSAVSTRIAAVGASRELAPAGPASAGAQPRSPLSEGGTVSLLALGAAATLEAPVATPATPPTAAPTPAASAGAARTPRKFRAGPDEVYLHPLSVGVQVLAGTVLGHLGAGTGAQESSAGEEGPHMIFQIRPAGVGAPLIDPKPILDGWVQLENTSVFRAKGENPFLGNSPTVGQVLLESKEQLEQQVLSDPGIHLPACGRQDIQTGQVDRRVLATLEFLSVSGLHPTVSSLRCNHVAPADAANAAETAAGDTVAITAINGIAIADHQGPGSIAELAIHKLSMLQGTMKPNEIVSLTSYPEIANTVAAPSQGKAIRVEFASLQGAGSAGRARAAGAFGAAITPEQWVQLIARLGEIPDPKVAGGPSSEAIPDNPGTVPGALSRGATSTSSTGSSGASTGGEG
jgi:soluble lytic murein transglycosylase-like protein